MEHDEKQANEEQQTEENEEMDDLAVTQQKAEDVKGGAIGRIEPRFPTTP
jgi:hypothetical protein